MNRDYESAGSVAASAALTSGILSGRAIAPQSERSAPFPQPRRRSGCRDPQSHPKMPRISASSHGESRLRMLRVVRRGDRHDPKDLTVSCRFEGDFGASFTRGPLRGAGARRGAEEPRARDRAHRRPRRDRVVRPGALRAPAVVVSADHEGPRRDRRTDLVAARDRRQGAGPGVRGGRRASGGRRPSPATAGRSRSSRGSSGWR